jgi:opacity protein-like surface antigen
MHRKPAIAVFLTAGKTSPAPVQQVCESFVMKKSVLAAAVTSAALMFTSGASADGEHDWYTTIFAGAAFGDDLEVTYDFGEGPETFDFPLQTGYLLGWTIGHDNVLGTETFRLRPEAELSFRQQDVDLDEIDDGIPDNLSMPADVLSLMANLWVDFAVNGIRPYAGGGVGIGWADLPLEGIHLEAADFVWQFGGGVNFDINSLIFVGIGYRYFGGDFEGTVEDDTFEYEYRTHQVLANLGVRF